MTVGKVAIGQSITKISATVIDSITEEPIPFANVIVKGTTIGATTDFEGKFSLKYQKEADTILVSVVGYKPYLLTVKIGSYNELTILLSQNVTQLAAVDIFPGENPAHRIMRNVWENKDSNSMRSLDAYQYEIYNKMQIDMNNVSEKFQQRRFLKKFEFVFDHIDTSEVNGKSYLPIFITEAVSDFYYLKSSGVSKEYIKASQVSGVKNESVSQFMGNMYLEYNIYDNYMMFFNKNFVSPAADFGLLFYKYYLIDSVEIGGDTCYQIMFKPKRKQELTFSGELFVDRETWAIKKYDMQMAKVNLNYVNDMTLRQEFTLVDSAYWMPVLDEMVVDFNVINNTKEVTGFYAHKTSSYKNFVINQPKEKSFYRTPVNIYTEDSSFYRDDVYWDSIRHMELAAEEEVVYHMIDTVSNLPIFRTWVDIIAMIATGYYNTSVIDYGPYFRTYSFNEVEGHRFRLGGRTSNELMPKLRLEGHLAYGTLDERYKYAGEVTYMLNTNPRRSTGLSYKYDVEQLGESFNAFKTDNIMATLMRRRPFTKLTYVEEFKGYYEHEYFNGLSNTLTFRRREVFPLVNSNFVLRPNGNDVVFPSLLTSELVLNTRFAFREVFVVDKFNRTSLGTKHPTVNLWYSYGIPNFLGSQFSYHKLEFSMEQWFNVWNIGWSRYIINAGKLWGEVPFPLLIIHPGNETYSFDKYAFNRVNYYEFMSDAYLSVYYAHHFDGFFLNHIPLMRKLKWREVAYVKGMVGSLSAENQQYSNFPQFSGGLEGKPYLEAGVGVENILKIFRVDVNWRMTHLDHQDIVPFGLMVTMFFDF
jgi:hypothetical protein